MRIRRLLGRPVGFSPQCCCGVRQFLGSELAARVWHAVDCSAAGAPTSKGGAPVLYTATLARTMNLLKYLPKRRNRDKGGPYARHRRFRPRTDLSALVDAIRAEGRASLAEERREDRGKRRREWITIGLIALTLFAIWLQVREMQRAYGPIAKQADTSALSAAATKEAADAALSQVKDAENALELAQRAWVGPSNAAFAAEPQAGKPIDISITYQNSGREPALNFGYNLDTFVTVQSGDLTKTASARMGSYEQMCQTTSASTGGSVVYPSTGFSSYTLSDALPSSTLDARFSERHEILVIQGCFWYRTFDAQKHSYFCYFYRPKKTKIADLNICVIGADAN